jgi:LEA14-like dessication related protein
MRALKIILAGVTTATVITGVYVYMKYQEWIDKVKYGIAEGVKLKSMDFKSSDVIIPIFVYNPSPFSFIASKLRLNIYVNGIFIGNITTGSYKIKPNLQTTLQLNLRTNNENILELLSEQGSIFVSSDWKEEVNFRVTGLIDVYSGPFYKRDIPIDISEKISFLMS